jgi:hypothetical protein
MLRRRPLVARVEMDEDERAEAQAKAARGHGRSHGGPASANPVA